VDKSARSEDRERSPAQRGPSVRPGHVRGSHNRAAGTRAHLLPRARTGAGAKARHMGPVIETCSSPRACKRRYLCAPDTSGAAPLLASPAPLSHLRLWNQVGRGTMIWINLRKRRAAQAVGALLHIRSASLSPPGATEFDSKPSQPEPSIFAETVQRR
jgi:hypothetical protein